MSSTRKLLSLTVHRNNIRLHSALSKRRLQDDPQQTTETEWTNAKPFDQIPGPKLLPVIGSSWTMFPFVGNGIDPHRLMDFNRHQMAKYGRIWRDIYPGMEFPLVWTTRPEDAERLFRGDGRFPLRPTFETLKVYRRQRVQQYTTTGILLGNGSNWWRIRSKAQQPLLKTKNMNSYVPIIGRIADEFIDRIRLIRLPNNEMRPDFLNEMYKWALESVAVVALNTRLGCLKADLPADSDAQKMIQAANTSFAAVRKLEFALPFWKLFQTPLRRSLFDAQDFFTETSIKYIQETVQNIQNRPADFEGEPTILEELLLRGLSLEDTVVMVIDMLMAGIDTTSHSSSFLFYLLARNPEKQQKLREEILQVVGPRGTPVTASSLNQLHYLKACVKESLRMMPAVTWNLRITSQNLVLSGYQVPKGSLVFVLHQLMCRLEEYFPRANQYVPERWIKGHPLENEAHPYVMLPFGFGTRMCIGRRLAELEMWQLTIKVIQNFHIEYHYSNIDCFSRMINLPDQPLRFRFVDLP